tara:strand:- start:42 stop:962 length:921 start_codon:yes stop_codon:yes gene_type:complete
MASEILGLFGGQNSQQLRNNALDSMMISPSQMGSQGLLQQVVSMGQNAGTMAGMGAGRLMGGKVAGEVEASYLEQAIQAGAAGKTPVEKMKLVAAALEDKPGMGGQYMKALSEARRLEAEDFTMEDAQFKRDNRTRDMKETRMVPDGLGGTTPKQFYWTETYNPQTKKFEQATTPSTEPPAAEGDKKPTELEKIQAELARQKAAKEGKGTSTATATPQSVNDFVTASTSNNETAAVAKQTEAAAATAKDEAATKDIANLSQLTPAVISGLTREQAIAVFKKYKKSLTKEQTDAILEKAGARRTQFR